MKRLLKSHSKPLSSHAWDNVTTAFLGGLSALTESVRISSHAVTQHSLRSRGHGSQSLPPRGVWSTQAESPHHEEAGDGGGWGLTLEPLYPHPTAQLPLAQPLPASGSFVPLLPPVPEPQGILAHEAL